MAVDVVIKPIGVIHTPYKKDGFTPNQPIDRDEGECVVELAPEFEAALSGLARFSHVYLVSYLHEQEPDWDERARPPWAKGVEVGLFASRSARRPNKIGLSIARLKRIEGNKLITSLLDVYDGTPLLDVKPYLKGLDAREDANNGWVDDLGDAGHILQHLRGAKHEHHDHHHGHDHRRHHDEKTKNK